MTPVVMLSDVELCPLYSATSSLASAATDSRNAPVDHRRATTSTYVSLLQATTLYCLVLEYAPGGDLSSYLKQQEKGRLSEADARTFVRQLVSALHCLHDKNIVHR